MKKIRRVLFFGVSVFALIMAGCAPGDTTLTPVGTIETDSLTGSPSPMETDGVETTATDVISTTAVPTDAATETAAVTPTATQQTGLVPVTGGDIRLLENLFCIDTMAYAILVIPTTATFEIVDPDPPPLDATCNIVDTLDDEQVVLCRAPENSTLILDVCTDDGTCTPVTVEMAECPDVITSTPQPGGATNTPAPGASPTAGTPTITPTP